MVTSSDPNHKNHYYAVIFTSTLTGDDLQGYHQVGVRMDELALKQEGCLGMESARNSVDGDPFRSGITVSYWSSLEAIQQWKAQAEHIVARQLGREVWYRHYHVRIAKVEREYKFQNDSSANAVGMKLCDHES